MSVALRTNTFSTVLYKLALHVNYKNVVLIMYELAGAITQAVMLILSLGSSDRTIRRQLHQSG